MFWFSTSGYFAQYFGGVNAFTEEQYRSINGFSNVYFGWGGEGTSLYKIRFFAFFYFYKF